ncbi:MAG: Gfo/Idh/MocA family oxidoreductase [Rubrivivax sp.]|nr:Gfo/Idh/MocA family oxidoreductase [Rubrivivax sp.]
MTCCKATAPPGAGWFGHCTNGQQCVGWRVWVVASNLPHGRRAQCCHCNPRDQRDQRTATLHCRGSGAGRTCAWAIVGPGPIAHRFAEALVSVPGTRLAAVCGRDAGRAAAFAARWAGSGEVPPQATTDLNALLADPAIDAVYIASPHAFHAAAAQRALAAGKAVLCEKPLTPNTQQTQALIALAAAQQCLLVEAVWIRWLPVWRVVGDWLRDGRIGALRALQSSFCVHRPFDATHRIHDPAQAGGALLDIGIYNINASRMVAQAAGRLALGAPSPCAAVHAVMAPSGVDNHIPATLDVGGGLLSQFDCGFDGMADNSLRITGELGHIALHGGFWQSTAATLHRAGQEPLTVQAPFDVNGFEYQIRSALRCWRAGLIEVPELPHAETLAVVALMDAMRARIELRYPFE